ncbi:hypothetical protein BH11PLA1_BH11PLA1_17680 [soil metagenome]
MVLSRFARFAALLISAAASFAGSARAAPILYEILPPAGAGNFTYGKGISADGSFAVGYADFTTDRAIRWNVSTGTQNLGTIPGSTLWSYGFAISDSGAACVGWGSIAGSGNRGFRWNGAMTQMAGVPGWDDSNAYAISGDGLVAAGQSRPNSSSPHVAVRWTNSGATIQVLGTLAGGTTATAWSTDGTGAVVCGQSGTSSGQTHAFRWTSAGAMQDLGILSGAPGSIAYAVSNDGSTIVGTSGGNAFRFIGSFGPMQSLGTPGGSAAAYAVSANGAVIGGAAGGAAYIWSANGGWKNLNTWLPSLGVSLSGWTLTAVRDISTDGTAMVGEGVHNGVTRGWVVRGIPCFDSPSLQGWGQSGGVCVGDPVFFNVAAVGPGTNTFQWRRNSINIFNGPTGSGSVLSGCQTATLNIANTQASDAATYDCVITGPCGVTISSTITGPMSIAPLAPPTINPSPRAVFVCAGDSLTLATGAAGGGNTTYSWTLNGSPLQDAEYLDGTSITGTSTPNLLLGNLQPGEQGTFSCTASNYCGTVSWSQVVGVQYGVGFTQQPSSIQICPGSSTSFTVNVPGATFYQWQFKDPFNGSWNNLPNFFYSNNGVFFTISGNTSATINLGNVQNNGFPQLKFRCRAGNPCLSTSDEGVIAMPFPAVAVTQNPQNVSACALDVASFTCAGNQNPGLLAFFWLYQDGAGNWNNIFDGLNTDPGTGMAFSASGAGFPTMNLSGVTLGTHVNPVKIQCIITGPCGSATTTIATWTINSAPCGPCDIAYDDGTPLCDPTISTNSGVNEGDYNCFFNNFFTNQAVGSPADIACDDGTPLPPWGPGGCDNNGVNEGDYNCFFNYFFQGCLN